MADESTAGTEGKKPRVERNPKINAARKVRRAFEKFQETVAEAAAIGVEVEVQAQEEAFEPAELACVIVAKTNF